jgi:hypothetical protein
MTLINCRDCKHWKGNRHKDKHLPLLPVDEEFRMGECTRLIHSLDIDLIVGWEGGYVRTIHTPASFGCVLAEKYSENN